MDFPLKIVGLNRIKLAELLASVEEARLAEADAHVIVEHRFLFPELTTEGEAVPIEVASKPTKPSDIKPSTESVVRRDASRKDSSTDDCGSSPRDPPLETMLKVNDCIATHCVNCEYESASDFDECPKCGGKRIVQIDRRGRALASDFKRKLSRL